MRKMLAVSALLLLIAGNAHAGSEYDRCIREEKVLKAREASQCSGFNYIVNPSACFTTQKALKEYTSTDKCKKIGVAEQVDFTPPAVAPAKKTGSVNPAGENKAAPLVPQQKSSCEQLRDENAQLKEKITRLKAEIEQLRTTSH